jgi:heptosyltransferase I
LTWVIGTGAYEAVSGLADEGIEFVVIDKPRRFADYLALRRRLRGRCFDALLCLQASWRANWIYPMISARRKIGFGADRDKDFHRLFVRECLPPARPHLAEGFLQFAEVLGLPFPKMPEWRLPVGPEALAWADTVLPQTPFLAFSPCSSKPERDWPSENYAEVLRHVHQKSPIPIVVLGGPSAAERSAIDRILALAKVPVLDLAGKTRIPQLMAALSRCRLLLAPDTGAVHIANAFGKPVLGLYAVAPSRRTGPYPDNRYCIDRFDEAVKTLLHKDPSTSPWSLRVHRPDAMALIKPIEVIEQLDAILG